MRPDRIILRELRGPEAYTFLRSGNTGHPGSMTTIHADKSRPRRRAIALLMLQGDTQLSPRDVLHYVRASIGVFVQLSRRHGRRTVTEIQPKEPSE
jgi:type IV secretion system protein VirB11